MFAAQIEALSAHFRCIAWDHRGQGASAMPEERTIDIETCTADAIELIGQLDAAPCHFVGLSMGGFVGMRIAARRPELIRKLVLIETAADAEPEANRRKYRVLATAARIMGVNRLLARQVMPIMFGDSFMTDTERQAEREEWTAQLMGNSRRIYRAVNGVIDREPVTSELPAIDCPTLVLHGDQDKAISQKRAMDLVADIPDARFVTVRGAGHTSSVEQPGAVTAAIAEFLGV